MSGGELVEASTAGGDGSGEVTTSVTGTTSATGSGLAVSSTVGSVGGDG